MTRRRSAIALLALGIPLTGARSALSQPAPVPAAAPPAAAITTVAKTPTVVFGGLLQVQMEAGDRADSRFGSDHDRIYLRRARINATGKVLPEIDFRLEIDLAGGIGAVSGVRAQLTDAFLNWTHLPAASVRLGQFKSPFGYEQLFSDPRLPAIERSLSSDRLTHGRQIGAQVWGELLDKRLAYSLGAFNGTGTNTTANDDDRFLLAGRLSAIPWQGELTGDDAKWSFGVDGFSSEDGAVSLGPEFAFDSSPATVERDGIFAGRRRGAGFDTQWQWGRLELWAEYLTTRFEPDNRRPAAELAADGWMVQGTYTVIPDRLQVLLRHDRFDPSDRLRGNEISASTFGASWFLKGHDAKLMLNYLRSEPNGQPAEDRVLARVQVSF